VNQNQKDGWCRIKINTQDEQDRINVKIREAVNEQQFVRGETMEFVNVKVKK